MANNRRRQAAAVVLALGAAVAMWQGVEAHRGFDYMNENPFFSDGFIARVQTGIAIGSVVVAVGIALWLWIPRRKSPTGRKN